MKQQQHSTTFSRRQFAALMGMGIATVSMGSLTGCAAHGKGVVKTYSYDVVVIGSGGAGTTAAAFAAQNGAKTVCLESFRSRVVPVRWPWARSTDRARCSKRNWASKTRLTISIITS